MPVLLDLLVVPEGARATGASHDRLRVSSTAMRAVATSGAFVPLLLRHAGPPGGSVGRFRYEPGTGLLATAYMDDDKAADLGVAPGLGVSLGYSVVAKRLDSKGVSTVYSMEPDEVSLTPTPSLLGARVLKKRTVGANREMSASRTRAGLAPGLSSRGCPAGTGRPCRSCSTATNLVTHHISAWAFEPA